MASIKQQLKTPGVPNFILFETRHGLRQEGLKETPSIPVGELSDELLIEIANDWKEALLARAAEQRKSK